MLRDFSDKRPKKKANQKYPVGLYDFKFQADYATPYCQSPSLLRLSSFMASLVVLGLFINANQYALAVLPVILIASHVRISLKRNRHLFYGFYPVHLTVILLAKTAIGIY